MEIQKKTKNDQFLSFLYTLKMDINYILFII